jgi:large subunit ribosomal protein L7Ae
MPRLHDQPPVKKGTGKKPAAAPFGASKPAKAVKNPLFESHPKNFSIGIYVIDFLVCVFKPCI